MFFAHRWARLSLAAALFAAVGLAGAQSNEIKPFRSGVHTVKAVFDTRIGTPISTVRLGGEGSRPENPLVFVDNPFEGTPTTVKLGGLLATPRTFDQKLFPGIDQDRWAPPDPTLAVGPDHVVVTTNMKIGFFRKSDGQQIFLRWLGNQEQDGFFRALGARDFTFDPKCHYDRNTGRFFVICPEYYGGSRESWMNIAVSDDSDPNGLWYQYRINTRATIGGIDCWLDYPGLGVTKDVLFFTGNMFGFSGGFGGVLVRSIPVAPLLSGGNLTFADFAPGGASAQCAQTQGDSNGAFIVNVNGSTSMRIMAVIDALTNPVLRTTTVSVPAFSNPNTSAPNRGGSIDTLDGRIMNVWFQGGRLLAAHAVRSNSGDRTVGRWYDFDVRGWPQSGQGPTLLQSGNADSGSPNYHLFPAVAFNDFRDMGMVLGRSSTNEFAGVYTTGRRFTDPDGALGALTLAKIGTIAANGRWGDYFGAQVDPDGLTFWGVGQWQDSSGWRTWIASWRVAEYAGLNVRANLDGTGEVNVPVTCTKDGRGLGDGATPYARTYYRGTQVVLEAPATFQGKAFKGWFSPTGNISLGINTPRLSIALNGPLTLTVRYGD